VTTERFKPIFVLYSLYCFVISVAVQVGFVHCLIKVCYSLNMTFQSGSDSASKQNGKGGILIWVQLSSSLPFPSKCCVLRTLYFNQALSRVVFECHSYSLTH
jgi:hypothetical protein